MIIIKNHFLVATIPLEMLLKMRRSSFDSLIWKKYRKMNFNFYKSVLFSFI